MNTSADDREVPVQSMMTPLPLQTSPPTSTIKELADEMNKHGRGAIVIVDSKDHPVGIITERDIVRRVVSAVKDPNKVTASEVMSKPVISVDPEMSLHNAALTMTKYKIRRLPVVRDTVLYGIVTAGDMAKRLYEKDKSDPTLAAMSRFQLIEQQV
ncbi:MAG TPA: CBS domain-containing protein [Nitrososphaera sp.]|jgi:CBS domain-containing protein